MAHGRTCRFGRTGPFADAKGACCQKSDRARTNRMDRAADVEATETASATVVPVRVNLFETDCSWIQ
jgi:hypothetical protein